MLQAIKTNALARALAVAPRRRCGPIGLDLGQERLHLVQMDSRGEEPSIRAATSVEYPGGRDAVMASPTALRALLRHATSGTRFSGRRVVTCLPANQVRLWPESYRVTHDRSEGATVLALALERVGGAAADWVVDFIPVRRESADAVEREAILACARREHVLAHLELLTGAGLEVEAVEVGPVAVQRLVAAVSASTTEENLLTINVGRDRTFLTVFAGRRLMVEREAAVGEMDLVRRVAGNLQVAEAQARALVYRHGLTAAGHGARGAEGVELAISSILKPRLLDLVEEVEKVVIYTASKLRGAPVDRVFLLGGLARWPGAADALNRMLALPVEVMDPLKAFSADVPDTVDAAASAGAALAAGSALRGIVTGV